VYIVYYDESGDDGYPNYSSPLFALSCIYVSHLDYQDTYDSIYQFRLSLKNQFNLPTRLEFHTKYFLLNKNPYKNLNLSDKDRILILDQFCNFIGQCKIQSINVVINKPIIREKYNVLDKALTFSIQRIENTLRRIAENEKYLIISDAGRIGKMCYTSRKIQKINYIRSTPNIIFPKVYNSVIKNLIEDPLQKESKESYFIQITDLISFVVYAYSMFSLGIGSLSKRILRQINYNKTKEWMDILKKIFNLKATKQNEYGIFYHPYSK
jgi:hypothetical protein